MPQYRRNHKNNERSISIDAINDRRFSLYSIKKCLTSLTRAYANNRNIHNYKLVLLYIDII